MKIKKALSLLIFLLVFVSLPAQPALGNSAEPPGFIIITANPPADLVLFVRLNDGREIELNKEQQAWEAQFHFYHHQAGLGSGNKTGMLLLVQSTQKSFSLPLPDDLFLRYSNLQTLDLRAQTLTPGQPSSRVPLLVALRVGLTLLIEGFIFFLFGYRRKVSWAIFLSVNLLTQTGLNALITGPVVMSGVIYYLFLFVFGELIILLAETAVFSAFLKESSRRRAALFALTANLASLMLGGWLIANLPI